MMVSRHLPVIDAWYALETRTERSLEVSKEILETRRRHESCVMTGVTGYLTARAVSTMFMEVSLQRKELTDDQ